MKKLLLFVVAAMSCVACTLNIEGVDTLLGYTKLTVGMPSSRTELGEKINGAYQVYWSEGDQLVVNGGVSTNSEISEDRKSATFYFDSGVTSPYYLTYPYTEGSLCENGRPTVTFPAEQTYFAKSFGVGYAPMCGYCEQGEASVSHLAGVMRLSISGNTTLVTIEVIADNGVALSGEFDVDCQAKTIAAIEGKTTNKITYTANQPLSEETTLFHITVPYGNLGKCQVVLTDNVGAKMNLKWTATDVQPGVVREFKPFAFNGGATLELQEMTSITDNLEVPATPEQPELEGVWGYVKYDDGSVAIGVSVSDGFSVVKTNSQGLYQFVDGVHTKTKYIYLSLPATAKVVMQDDGYHTFFKCYSKSVNRYDFTLEKIEKESEFALFAIADTHGAREKYVERVRTDCLGGVRAEKQRRGSMPCYAVILGDIVCAAAHKTEAKGDLGESANTKFEEERQKTYYMPLMREMFATSNTGGVPTFYVMGNHDHDRNYFYEADKMPTLEEFNYHAQDAFEEMFCPANYSFNRGNTHIVCMRDCYWNDWCWQNNTSDGNNTFGDFSDAQVEWLRQDLANVSKDKKVIICVHIPLTRSYNSKPNIKTVVDMIAEYNEPQILSGHTHVNKDVKVGSSTFGSYPVSEKTVSGNWGTGSTKTAEGFTEKCTADGMPFGFDVYDIKGANFTDHYYVDCTSNLSHRTDCGYVMRVYLSKDIYGGDSDGDGVVKNEKYFMFPNYDSGDGRYNTYIHVNLFNGTPDTWVVELYVNGKYVRQLAYGSNSGGAWKNEPYTDESGVQQDNYVWQGNGSGTYEDPWWPSVVKNSQDWWCISYKVNEGGSKYVTSSCSHMWYGYILNKYLEDVKAGNFYIKATHTEFGKSTVYTTSKIFRQGDHNGYVNYKPKNE